MVTHFHGLKIDAEKIAQGMFDMMPDDDKACMVVGMLPLKWMELVERQIREKVAKVAMEQAGYIPVDNDELEAFTAIVKNDVVKDIMHSITVALLQVATKEGICQV